MSVSNPVRPIEPVPAPPRELHLVDAEVVDPTVLTDAARLRRAARHAVAAGGGHVLDTSHVMFPNGAVTLVLILAESHLAIHTWPEDNLIAIDLFSCGAIDGYRVAAELGRLLGLDQVHMRQIERGTVRPGR